MTVSKTGIINQSARKVVDRVNTELSTFVGAGVTATASELNVLAGATLSTAELNVLAGVTATASELNVLAGVTATNQDLQDLHTNIAKINQLNNLQITGCVASGDFSSVIQEIMNRVIALENK